MAADRRSRCAVWLDADATFGAGGQRGFSNLWGGSYQIIGDGATATRGLMTQSAVVDANGLARIAANTSYSVRARVMAIAPLTHGSLHIHLYSASAASIPRGWS